MIQDANKVHSEERNVDPPEIELEMGQSQQIATN